MSVTASEKDIIEIVGYYKKAGSILISQKMGVSDAYTDLLCKSLIRKDYLIQIATKVYILAPKGQYVLEKMKEG